METGQDFRVPRKLIAQTAFVAAQPVEAVVTVETVQAVDPVDPVVAAVVVVDWACVLAAAVATTAAIGDNRRVAQRVVIGLVDQGTNRIRRSS